MSTLITQARNRVPRFAEAAVERARLTVVPPRRAIGRTQAARTPFAILVIAMLVTGVVGLLMFNTNMQQASFKATALQEQVNTLTAKEQALNMQLDSLRDPQRLATEAKDLGMVPPSSPAFIELATGRILGTPAPATLENAVRINPLPAPRPDSLKQKIRVVKVPAKTTGGSQADTRGSSTATTRESGRKKANAPAADSGASH
jgi:cell division protein FtsL